MNSNIPENKAYLIETQMVESIKQGYFECRNFFEQHTNNEIESYFEKKKKFMTDLCQEFYSQFSQNEKVYSEDNAIEFIEKYQKVFIFYRNGTLEFPTTFSLFIDRIKDVNNIPKEPPNMFDVDRFIKTYDSSRGLDHFLHGLFKRIRRIIIFLRDREVQVLKLVSNTQFLSFKYDGSRRIIAPTDNDILKALQLTKKQFTTISRAVNLLFRFKICNFSTIIMNASKLGFYYALYDDYSQNFNLDKKDKFWEIPFAHFNSKIACVPFSEVDQLKVNYLPLTHWYWNVNLEKYYEEKKSVWNTFNTPDFFAENLKASNYVKWSLNEPLAFDVEKLNIDIIKRLSATNFLTPESLSDLSAEKETKYVANFLQKMVDNDVYQCYSNVNFIGSDYRIAFRFDISDQKLFTKVLNGLLMYPISQIFTNDQVGSAFGYVKMPRHVVSNFFDFHDDFVDEYPEHRFDVSTASKVLISRCHNLSNIDFSIRDGVAYRNTSVY